MLVSEKIKVTYKLLSKHLRFDSFWKIIQIGKRGSVITYLDHNCKYENLVLIFGNKQFKYQLKLC